MPSLDALLPVEMARRAETIGVAKANGRIDRVSRAHGARRARSSGSAAVFSTVVTSGTRGPAGRQPPARGALTFSLGLVLVVVGGAELFTGNTLIVIGHRRADGCGCGPSLRSWAIVYVGNLGRGACATALLVYWSGMYEGAAVPRGPGHSGSPRRRPRSASAEAVLLGVLANALVCLAVWLSFSARSVFDKVVAVVFPVSAFVAAGFEHSIANMYFLPAGLFIKTWAPASFWTATGAEASDYPSVTWGDAVVGNLLPRHAGQHHRRRALLVGLVYWFVYLRRTGSDSGLTGRPPARRQGLPF